jgi:serine/threonine-protein kinase
MVMVQIPAGEFLMGSESRDADEKPQHTVSLDAFWIDQTEVTNGMYAQCVTDGECETPQQTESYTRSSYYGDNQYDAYPVVNVNWNQANIYCGWAGRRLPSEAEWEKAARSTDGRTYPWGEQSLTCSLANFSGCEGDTTAVGSYPQGASVYGALDMAGNVWEWVADWYQVYPGGDANASSYFGQTHRVLRGGSWVSDSWLLRSSGRLRSYPDLRYNNDGFRCAR